MTGVGSDAAGQTSSPTPHQWPSTEPVRPAGQTGDRSDTPDRSGPPDRPDPPARLDVPVQPDASAPPDPERDDVELLQAHVAGDRDAFATLFHRHRDRLWAVALRTLADREEAADALQDALLSAHRAAARFRGDAAVTTWLHRIVVNACLDRIRRRQAHPTVPLESGRSTGTTRWTAGVEPAAPAIDHDTALVVRQALAELPIEQRAALVLVDLQGYPVAQVAEILGVAEGTVKSRCARGRARLAVLLGHLRPRSAESEDAESGRDAEARQAGRTRRGAQAGRASGSGSEVPSVTRGNLRRGTGVGSTSTRPRAAGQRSGQGQKHGPYDQDQEES